MKPILILSPPVTPRRHFLTILLFLLFFCFIPSARSVYALGLGEEANHIKNRAATIVKTEPTLTFSGLVNGELRKTYGNPDFDLTVTTNSTGTVTYSIVREAENAPEGYSGDVNLYGDGNKRVTIEQAGKVRLRAMVAETTTHAEKSVEVDLMIAKASRLLFIENQTATYSPNGYTLLEANVTQGGGDISYTVVTQNTTAYPGQVGLNGKQVAITKSGRVRIKATVAEDANYLSASKEIDLVIQKASAVPFLSNLVHTYDGTEKAATVTITPANLDVRVTYAGTTAPPTNAGNFALVATVMDDNYEGRTTGTFTIHKASQTISFTNPGAKQYGDAPFDLQAMGGGSGNPVTFSIRSGNAFASISGKQLIIRGAGAVTVRAVQASSANYDAATFTEETFIISKAPLTVGVENATRIYGVENPSFVLTFSGFVNGDDMLDLDLRPTSKPAAVTPATSTSNVGTYDITVSGGTDAKYEYTTYTKGTLTIIKAPQVIALAPITDKKLRDVFSLPATTDAGLIVTYTSSTPSVATVAGNEVTVAGLGHTDITATQAGDMNHEAAESKTQTLRVTITSSAEEVASAKIKVYPNPATADNLLLSGLPQEAQYEVQVVDLVGRTVQEFTLKPVATGKVQVNLTGLRAGQYLLRIQAAGLLLTKRFIKSR